MVARGRTWKSVHGKGPTSVASQLTATRGFLAPRKRTFWMMPARAMTPSVSRPPGCPTWDRFPGENHQVARKNQTPAPRASPSLPQWVTARPPSPCEPGKRRPPARSTSQEKFDSPKEVGERIACPRLVSRSRWGPPSRILLRGPGCSITANARWTSTKIRLPPDRWVT